MHPSQGLWFPGVMAMAWLLSPARGRLGVWLGIQPQKRGVSKCSVQPGGCQRGRTPRLSGLRRFGSSDMPLRTAVSRLNGTLRNITVFSHGYENISAAVPGEKQAGDKDGRERPAAEIFLRGVGYERGKREERREKREGIRDKG